MTEAFDPKPLISDDGWKGLDFDGLGNPFDNTGNAYSSETGLPAIQEVDAQGNPPGTEYDANGQPIFPLR